MNQLVHAEELPGAARKLSRRATGALLTVLTGSVIGINFVLAKFAVQNGVAPFAAFYWQLLGASFVLLCTVAVTNRQVPVTARYLRYYLVGGIFGVAGPNILAFVVLQHVPAGLFTVLVTLSPLLTFVFSSLVARQWLPGSRLAGVLVGFAGVSLATMGNVELRDTAGAWVLLAVLVPAMLAGNNVYRHRAYPAGADPLALAAGTLLLQVFLLWPVVAASKVTVMPLALAGIVDVVLLLMGVLSALGYVLIFRLQQYTDGLGTSQVGYFITLSGVLAGAVLFGERLSFLLLLSVALVFAGVAITNATGSPARAVALGAGRAYSRWRSRRAAAGTR